MIISNFPEIGKFLQTIGLLFFAFSGIYAPVFRFRGLLLTPPDFVTEFPPKTADTARGGGPVQGADF